MNNFYIRSFIFIVLILISVTNLTFSQSCQDCGRRTLGVYDPNVMVPRPTGTDLTEKDLLPRWWQLFRVGDYIRAYLHNQDASSSCIYFMDIHIKRGETGWEDTLITGPEYAFTAPAGPVNALDYLIQSSISGTEGNYTLDVSLEAAVSREVVASGSTTFTDMWNAPDAGQQLAAQLFSPIYDKIRAWEEKKRDEDQDIVIGTEKITLKPQKTKVEAGESVPVDITFIDCDEKPLKNKKLQLIGGTAYGMTLAGPTGGHFSEDYTYTDDEGKATATFIADNKGGVGVLRAYCIYKYPSGHNGLAGGEAVINISQPPIEFYEFNTTASYSLTYNRDTSWSWSVPGASLRGYYKDMVSRNGSISARGLIENYSDKPGGFWYDENGDMIAAHYTGSMSEIQIGESGEFVNGQQTGGDVRVDQMHGSAIPDAFSIQIWYDPETGDKMATFGGGLQRIGDYKGKWYDGPDWVDYDGKYNDSLFNIDGTYAPEDGWNGSFTKVDSGYVINASFTDNHTEHTLNGPASVSISKSFTMTVKPSSYLTAVRDENGVLVPDKSKLYQNYPNPFNPVTNIDYNIGKDANVTIKVYDILGKEICTLLNSFKKRGFYTVKFNAANLPSGIYFYRLSVDGYTELKKLIVLK